MADHGHATRSSTKFLEELKSHIPNREHYVLELCAREVHGHKNDFRDRSKFWEIALHFADAVQSERFGDPFLATLFYSQTAREIVKSGELNKKNLEWAQRLSERANSIFCENFSRGVESLNAFDIEMKHNLEALTEEISLSIKGLPGIRE